MEAGADVEPKDIVLARLAAVDACERLIAACRSGAPPSDLVSIAHKVAQAAGFFAGLTQMLS